MKVLDHGEVILRNLAGPTRRIQDLKTDIVHENGVNPYAPRPFDADDRDPAQAARLSFEDGSFGDQAKVHTYEQDLKLAEYLLLNEHSSPFEMVQVWIEVKVPIMIDRQMVRHRTWSRNESSARYIVLPNTWYIPETVGGKAANKKQGQEDNLSPEIQDLFKRQLQEHCEASYKAYQDFLEMGVAPEHARMFLHLNHYVHWLGSVDLHNMFHFLRLRVHDYAQIEAQKYGNVIVELLRPHLPGLMGLFDKHVRR